jgi:hypothetical protein
MPYCVLFELEYGYGTDALAQLSTQTFCQKTLSLGLCAIGRGHCSGRVRTGDALFLADALLEKGATFTEYDVFGSTALHYFCQANQYELTRLALEKGADLHARDRCGLTPLHWFCIAMRGFHPPKVSRLPLLLRREHTGVALPSSTWVPLLHLLLHRGGDLLEQDNGRYTPSGLAPLFVLEAAFYFLVDQPVETASLSVMMIIDLMERIRPSREQLNKAVALAEQHCYSELVHILRE